MTNEYRVDMYDFMIRVTKNRKSIEITQEGQKLFIKTDGDERKKITACQLWRAMEGTLFK